MDYLIGFLERTVEYKNFGLNAFFLSALATMFFTFFQGYGVWKQGKRIWTARSGESVSVTFFGYSAFYFFAFMCYGAEKWSIAMTMNGALGFVYLPILAGLVKFKRFTKNEWLLLGVFSLMIPAILILDGESQEIFLMVFLLGILSTIGKQAYEIWRTKSPGALEPKFIRIFMATNAFWLVYAIVIGSWPLMVFNPLSFSLLGVNLFLYRRYSRK